MRYSFRQLEVFAAVARHENVSRAAAELALSQSAASTALGEFERQFDAQVFDRTGKSLRLNELGRHLLPKALDVLARAGDIEALLRGQAGFGPLTIGATLTIGNYLATLIVAKYLRDQPASRVELRVHNTATIIDAVARFELDIGLVEGNCRHPDLIAEPWIADELIVFCAPDHVLAGRRRVGLKQLAEQPWIMREHGSGTRETLDMALRHYHGHLDIRLELQHTEAIKRAVESGLGIGCISGLALREAFRRGSLVPVSTPELDLRRQFHFVRHRQKFLTAGMREFITRCLALTAGARRSDEIELPYIA